ncbi:uncharacterized protein LOC121063857 [Cygnus olor]|uniref:uncharacterized protein LOC121063857 n=1 Tax=Cygnus olor TaxID=8869 RepID=UPI001ADDF2C0|nr:uncharacterized protein LOC121063857 [Cygnus olor]
MACAVFVNIFLITCIQRLGAQESTCTAVTPAEQGEVGFHARQLRTVPYVTVSWGFPGGGHFIQPLHRPRPPPLRRARGRRRLRLRLRLQAARRRLLTKWRRPWKRQQPHFVPGRACQQNADLAKAEEQKAAASFALRRGGRRAEDFTALPPPRGDFSTNACLMNKPAIRLMLQVTLSSTKPVCHRTLHFIQRSNIWSLQSLELEASRT